MDIKVKMGIVIINDNNEILLIKEKIKKKDRPLWNIIKGTYDGKKSIFEEAVRECQEEASISVELINSLGSSITKEDNKLRIQFNFLGKIKEGTPKLPPADEQVMRDENILGIRFFKKYEIEKMNPDEFISESIYKTIQKWIRCEVYPLGIYDYNQK